MVALLAGLRRHPALLPLAFQRVTACPDGLELTETALQILRDGGFSRPRRRRHRRRTRCAPRSA